MPNYDYICTACGKEFEIFQSMKDPHLTKCQDEACPGPMKRQLGVGAGFVFKGSGFYVTDYRSESYKAGAKSDSAASTPATPAPAVKEGGSSVPAKETKATPAPTKAPAPSTTSSS